jgi:hypothetical protein
MDMIGTYFFRIIRLCQEGFYEMVAAEWRVVSGGDTRHSTMAK